MRRYFMPLVAGIVGVAVLASLGVWQLQRLEWKRAILAEMGGLLTAPPMSLAEATEPVFVKFAPVRIEGRSTGEEIHVLHSTGRGAGYRLISGFETRSGRKVMLDEGFISAAAKDRPRPPRRLTVIGNLHQPDDADRFTPPPDLAANIWYGRDIAAMSETLGADGPYVVLRQIVAGEPYATPLPLDTSGIPNNHLGYAIQWFGLAIVWAGMTLFLLWRIRKRTV